MAVRELRFWTEGEGWRGCGCGWEASAGGTPRRRPFQEKRVFSRRVGLRLRLL